MDETAGLKRLRIGKITRTQDDRGLSIMPVKEVEIAILEPDKEPVTFSSSPDAAIHWAEMLLRYARKCQLVEVEVVPPDA